MAALTLAHGRNSVMFRMTEAQRAATVTSPHRVECWRWAGHYFIAAEVLWVVYLTAHQAWAALCGVAVFVGFARWRAWRAP